MLPLLLSLAQGSDPRLDVKATLLAPRLTYAELGAWVQKATGAPVTVSPAIRERKATVLVEDRPVRETMERVAEALFVRLEPGDGGVYTLKLEPKVAAEEATARAAAADARQAAIRQRLDDLVLLGGLSDEALKAERERDDEAAKDLDKAIDPASRMRRAELIDRARVASTIPYNGSTRAAGIVLAGMTARERAAILDGAVFYASNRPGPGLARLPDEAITAMAKNMPMLSTGKPVFYSVHYDSLLEEVSFAYGVTEADSAFGGRSSERVEDAARVGAAVALTAMGKRLREWPKADPATLATPLKPQKPETPPLHRLTPYKTLADLLVELHARTGLPVVADGFRLAMVAKRLPEGRDVAEWRRSLGNWSDGRYRGYQPLMRTDGGWVMMRHPRYWQQVAREVPEGPIRRLEASVRGGGVTLDALAAFGATITPAQEPWLAGEGLVMDAPSNAVDGKVPFLRLWASLTGRQRQEATTTSGLEMRALGSDQADLLLGCLRSQRGAVFGDTKTLPYLLPGGPPLPAELRLFVNPNAKTMNQEYEEYVQGQYGTGWDSQRDSVPGVIARIGLLDHLGFQQYDIPLRPSRKLWPDDVPPTHPPG